MQQVLVPGKEALENKILGAVTKGKSQGLGREAQGTQLLAAHSSSLHREHTTKLGNIHLCVLEPSSSEISLVDGPLCQDGVQKLRGCGALRHCCQPRFPSLPSPISEVHTEQGRRPQTQDDAGPASTTRTRGRNARTPLPSPSTPRHLNSTGRLRHCITHPWQGWERRDRLPVQSQPPTH